MSTSAISEFLAESAAIARRDLIRVNRQPQLATFGATMGLFFLLLFDLVFGGAIEAGSGVNYEQYLVPGILVMIGLFGANLTGVGLADDIQNGITDRFRSLPMRQGAVLAGRAGSEMVRNVVALVPTVIVGYIIGFRFDSVLGALWCVLLVLGLGFAFSWVNATLGAVIRDVEAMNMMGMMWMMPLMFVSSMFTPTDRMPAWLQRFADNQPISVTANAVRSLADESVWTSDATVAVVWIVALVAIFAFLGGRAYRRP